MDFSHLPDTVLLKILQYMPLENMIRVGRVDKTFRRIAQLATSHTKCLDLTKDRFLDMTSFELSFILDLCSKNLERISFPSHAHMENPSDPHDWNRRAAVFDNHGHQLVTVFSNYQCPRLTSIDLSYIPINYTVLEQIIRNNLNIENLVWRNAMVGFPNITNNNLKKLNVYVYNDAVNIQSLIGRFPNLIELELHMDYADIDHNLLDLFFGSIPQVHRIRLRISDYDLLMLNKKGLVNFWNLSLSSLSISFLDGEFPGDDVFFKVASSFPHLRKLHLEEMEPTNAGISALVALQELEILELHNYDFGRHQYDQGICQLVHCKKLQKLGVDTSSISGGTFVNFLRSCPHLEFVALWEMTQVDNPGEACVILWSLAGIPKRDITVEFHSSEMAMVKSIWDTEPVKEVIGKLEINDGIRIKIVWKEYGAIYGGVQEWIYHEEEMEEEKGEDDSSNSSNTEESMEDD